MLYLTGCHSAQWHPSFSGHSWTNEDICGQGRSHMGQGKWRKNYYSYICGCSLVYMHVSCAWSYAACSRHLSLFFSLNMPDKCTRNLVSSLLVQTWHLVYAWWHRRRVPCLWEWSFQGGHKQRGTVETQLLYFFGHKAPLRRTPNFSTRFF